jgi:hypothetical protein
MKQKKEFNSFILYNIDFFCNEDDGTECLEKFSVLTEEACFVDLNSSQNTTVHNFRDLLQNVTHILWLWRKHTQDLTNNGCRPSSIIVIILDIIPPTAFVNPDYLLWKISFILSKRQNGYENCAVLNTFSWLRRKPRISAVWVAGSKKNLLPQSQNLRQITR